MRSGECPGLSLARSLTLGRRLDLKALHSETTEMSASDQSRSLPNLRQKPSFRRILQTLESLEPGTHPPCDGSPEDAKMVFSFLMSITTSSLNWLDQEMLAELAQDRKGVLYDLAARRIAERCGRNGEFLKWRFHDDYTPQSRCGGPGV